MLWRNMSSSMAVRCATARSPGAIGAAYMDFLSADRHPSARAVPRMPSALGRRQCPSGQGRGALRDPGLVRGLVDRRAEADVRERPASRHAEPCAGGDGSVFRRRRCWRGRCARPENWDWRASPAAPAAIRPKPRTTSPTSPRPPPTPGRMTRRGAERSAAPLGAARAQIARDLYRRPDARRAGAGRPARGA